MTLKKPQKVGLYVHVNPSTKEQLQEIALEHETTMSSVIRTAIKFYLNSLKENNE